MGSHPRKNFLVAWICETGQYTTLVKILHILEKSNHLDVFLAGETIIP